MSAIGIDLSLTLLEIFLRHCNYDAGVLQIKLFLSHLDPEYKKTLLTTRDSEGKTLLMRATYGLGGSHHLNFLIQEMRDLNLNPE